MKSMVYELLLPRCPRCDSLQVRRSKRKNLVEAVAMRLALVRPYRCENCGDRYYGFSWRRRADRPTRASGNGERPRNLTVIVYGRGKDREPFREESSMRIVDAYSALLWIRAAVEPGQDLLLFGRSKEEGQKCRIAFVTDGMAGVVFSNPAWEFLSISMEPRGFNREKTGS